MRRIPRAALFAGGLALGFVLILGLSFAPDLGENKARAVPPAALNRIAQKNERAAVESAARMRANSAASAEAADALQDARERGIAEANATLARFSSDEPGEPASGR
jgi:hypothetical protein